MARLGTENGGRLVLAVGIISCCEYGPVPWLSIHNYGRRVQGIAHMPILREGEAWGKGNRLGNYQTGQPNNWELQEPAEII